VGIAVVIVAVWVMFRQGPVTAASAEPAVSQTRHPAQPQEVRSVSLDGRRLMLSRLRESIATKPGAQLDRERLEADRAAMERTLADLGYLAARVEPADVAFDAAGAAYVRFAIDQGQMFHLRNIEITGAGRDAVIVTLTTGDDAARPRIERAREELADALRRRGRPAAVELSVRTDVAAAAVDVVLATR
jgi:outer membrane protein assembly factor BamA